MLCPPRIQETLKWVHELRARLVATPGLTRDALALEVGINPGQLTRLLRLADLAPEIQRHILALSPSIHRCVVTERRLRAIARIKEHQEQLEEFRHLLTLPMRSRKKPLPAATLPSQPLPAHLSA